MRRAKQQDHATRVADDTQAGIGLANRTSLSDASAPSGLAFRFHSAILVDGSGGLHLATTISKSGDDRLTYIDLTDAAGPGIVGLFQFRPETARPLSELAEVLLRGPSSLSRGERELIAAYVSSLNNCQFCELSHSAFAAAQLPEGMDLVKHVKSDPGTAVISPKLKALLEIAAKVQASGLAVTSDDVTQARAAGATDVEIHDAVLIAAAFCMYNRYVDGLRAFTPPDPAAYVQMADGIVERGYVGVLEAPDPTPVQTP
jgi:uncharacterized peroxidase-related enzyme